MYPQRLGGRRSSYTPAQIERALILAYDPDLTLTAIEKMTGVARKRLKKEMELETQRGCPLYPRKRQGPKPKSPPSPETGMEGTTKPEARSDTAVPNATLPDSASLTQGGK